MKKIRILVVGCGHMGASHARAYTQIPQFEIAGLVSRGEKSRTALAQALGLKEVPLYSDYHTALKAARPDAVCIATYPDTHEEFALAAFHSGAHVFMEKPIATTVVGAENVVAAARRAGKKLVIGYILRHHPSWKKFVEIAQSLGKPLVMRMNLNQQSSGNEWYVHKNLMQSLAPMVDCGVHYVDIMCLMTGSTPVKINGISARLTDEIPPGQTNYGQLQVVFADGSVGWYEAGWGPMMSEEAFFIKDVIGPKGSVSMVAKKLDAASDDVGAHTKTNALRIHHAELGPDGKFARKDVLLDTTSEPDHDELCRLEQEYFLRSITENLDLGDHMRDAVNSLRIVLEAQANSLRQPPPAASATAQ
jgi:predicted dehydrogenase